MNASDYTYLLNHPEAVNQKRTDELDKIVAEFPYFQSARALRLKGLYNEDSFRYNYALKVTAAFSADRGVLFDFITSNAFTSVEKNAFAKKQEQLHEIQVNEDPKVEEFAMDDSFRASLDAEFVPVTDVKNGDGEPEITPPTDIKISDSDQNNDTEVEAVADEWKAEQLTAKPETAFATKPESERADVATDEIPEASSPDTLQDEHEVADRDASEYDVSDENVDDGNLTDELTSDETTSEEITRDEATSDEMSPDASEIYDPATKSVLESIKEAEQYARSLQVNDVEEVAIESEVPSDEIQNPVAETLEIGKPLEFTQGETHSFHEWLQLSQFQPIVRDAMVSDPDRLEARDESDDSYASEPDSGRQKKNELIDKFIQSNPKIPKAKPDSKPSAFIFEPSQPDNSYLMTETLARVYLEQQKFDKAIQAYEILILKYPEKSSFFADRILDIRNLQQNNKL